MTLWPLYHKEYTPTAAFRKSFEGRPAEVADTYEGEGPHSQGRQRSAFGRKSIDRRGALRGAGSASRSVTAWVSASVVLVLATFGGVPAK
jgi:hypothetical protein